MQTVRTGGLRNHIAIRTALLTSVFGAANPLPHIAYRMRQIEQCAHEGFVLEVLKMSLGESRVDSTLFDPQLDQ